MAVPLIRVSAPSRKYQRRPAPAPIFPAIPDLNASNSALVARQVNCPRPVACADSISNINLRIRAIFKVHNNSLELNAAALDLKLDRPKRSAGINVNVVMVAPAIYTRLSEPFPPAFASIVLSIMPLGTCSGSEAQYEQHRTEQNN